MSLVKGKVINTKSGRCEIIETGSFVVTVRFLDTGAVREVSRQNVMTGYIKDPLHPSVYGVGFIGEGSYRQCTHPRVYSKWSGLIGKCYGKNHAGYKGFGAKGVTVCKKWHNFQTFCKWFLHQCEKVGENPDETKFILIKEVGCVFSPGNTKLFSRKGLPKQRNT